MPDVIIRENFGMEKLRGLGNTGGVKVWALPLKRLVTLTTVLRYRTACDYIKSYKQFHGSFIEFSLELIYVL